MLTKKAVLSKIKLLEENYNTEVDRLSGIEGSERYSKANTNPSEINWTRKLKKYLSNGTTLVYAPEKMTQIMYRPFTKKWLYFNNDVVEMPSQYYKKWGKSNLTLVTNGRGSTKGFSVLVSNCPVDYQFMMNSQGFMRYDNEQNDVSDLFETNHDNVNQAFADKIGLSLDDTFAYVYGLLNSSEYQQKYANDLKKDLARIPVVAEKEKYVEVGKKLIDLHINYEEVPVYEGVQIVARENPSYVVKKMKFGKKRDAESGKLEKDRSTIVFNSDITIKDIPEKAYEYVVNGRSAIEWIMDQYQVKTDKKSGITDDPNDFSDDPKYIFNLLLRIINVSLQTVDLVNSLPKLEIIE